MKWIQRKEKKKVSRDDLPLDVIGKIRGISDIDNFLSPTSDELHDPLLMKNIQKASDRILEAINNDENVVVSYDCDADGITSGTIMVRYLRSYIDNVDFIYGERSSGHGISEQLKRVNEADNKERYELNENNIKKVVNADLLIIVDSSTNDVDTCERILNEDTDIIILDHHIVEKDNPHCILVNPQQDGCEYPNKHLSGAGVVLKTIEVVENNLGRVNVWQYIDLVAVGIYADVMRMDVLENRYLVMYGLRNMKNMGLVRILKGGGADFYRLNGDDIGFTIAPMLNGATRMDQIRLAIDILLEDDDKICKKLRLKIRDLNEERKRIQKEVSDRYSEKLDEKSLGKAIFISDEESSKGFNGLVAQQLSEKYRRPAFVGRLDNGVFSGSFRSYGDFKLKTFASGFDGDISVLGHEIAGGVVLDEELVNLFKSYLEKYLPDSDDLEPTIMYDLEINLSEINDYIRVLERYNMVTGNMFPKVIVKISDIPVEEPECIGKTRETVKIKTMENLELIKFKVDESYGSELGYFDEIDVVGELGMNEFYHWGLKEKISTPQVKLIDYRAD